MKVRLGDFETFPARTCLESDPAALQVDYDGVVKVNKVRVELDIQKSGEEFFCQADITADSVLECARCVEPFEIELTGRADFVVTSEAAYEQIRAEGEDDEDYVFYQGESLEIDLSDIIRQTIILAVPMMPLCAEDCKGLCPQCKVNRNEKTCDCKVDGIDERWAGLRDLFSA